MADGSWLMALLCGNSVLDDGQVSKTIANHVEESTRARLKILV
jgi:hypothetical protein